MQSLKHILLQKPILGWVLYDWANSAFATTIMAAVLPNYFSSYLAATISPAMASSVWAYGNTIAMLLIAIASPVLGAIADYKGNKRHFLLFFLLLGTVSTAALVVPGKGDWALAIGIYILAFMGFAGSIVFYDALLPIIAPPKFMNAVSVVGYAVGYLGGGLLLALNLWMILEPQAWGIADSIQAIHWAFVSVALWWAVFSIPLFLWVKEPTTQITENISPIKVGFQRIVTTLRHIRQYRQAFRFLIAFWLYSDGIGTIIKMAVIFGTEIGIGQTDLIGAILLVQFVGIPLSLVYIRLAQQFSTKRAIQVGLLGYSLITIGGFFIHEGWHFWLLAFLVGCVQGGTQALSRSLFGRLIPKEMSGEFFGFYDISQKFAGILGPLVFGAVAQFTHNSRWGIVALLFFFIGGIILLNFVEEPREGTQVAPVTTG